MVGGSHQPSVVSTGPRGSRRRIGLVVATALTLLATFQVTTADARESGKTFGLKAQVVGVNDLASTSEQVTIDAVLNIVVKVTESETTIHVNVQRSTAVGQTTGGIYQFHGADKIVVPGPPPTGASLLNLRIGQPGTLNIIVVQVEVVLTLNSAGEVMGAAASLPR